MRPLFLRQGRGAEQELKAETQAVNAGRLVTVMWNVFNSRRCLVTPYWVTGAVFGVTEPLLNRTSLSQALVVDGFNFLAFDAVGLQLGEAPCPTGVAPLFSRKLLRVLSQTFIKGKRRT